MQADLDRHIEKVRQRIDATKATVDAKAAESDADWAEANATDAIAFAMNAIVEAEYDTLDAVLARKNAVKVAASASCHLSEPYGFRSPSLRSGAGVEPTEPWAARPHWF